MACCLFLDFIRPPNYWSTIFQCSFRLWDILSNNNGRGNSNFSLSFSQPQIPESSAVLLESLKVSLPNILFFSIPLAQLIYYATLRLYYILDSIPSAFTTYNVLVHIDYIPEINALNTRSMINAEIFKMFCNYCRCCCRSCTILVQYNRSLCM